MFKNKKIRMQTILGSGGAIGAPLAKELKKYTNDIRLVSRNPKKINETDELFPVDVTDLAQISKAIAGSEIVYVVIGFEYKLSVWQKMWPAFMKEVITACQMHNTKLVFFDNLYLYAKSSIHQQLVLRLLPIFYWYSSQKTNSTICVKNQRRL